MLATSTPRFILDGNVTRPFRCGAHTFDLARPLVMGVLNVTPDSFSDGGRYLDRQSALAHARRMRDDGADLIDIGGESSRPGAAAVAEDAELERVIPLVDALAGEGIAVAVDTRKPAVMRAAIAAGASMINDIGALQAPGAIDACAPGNTGVCLMHMQGEPATMQDAPVYGDVVTEVRDFLVARAAACEAGGHRAPSASRSIPALASARRGRIISLCCGRSGCSPRPVIRCSSACRARSRSVTSPGATSTSGSPRASRPRLRRWREARRSSARTTCAKRWMR